MDRRRARRRWLVAVLVGVGLGGALCLGLSRRPPDREPANPAGDPSGETSQTAPPRPTARPGEPDPTTHPRDPWLFDASAEALDRAAWIHGAVVRCRPPAPLFFWPRYTVGSDDARGGRFQEYVSFGKSLREPILEFVTTRRSGAYRFAMRDPDHPGAPLGLVPPRVRLFDATWRDAAPSSVVACVVVPVPSGTVWVGVDPPGGPRSRVSVVGCGQWAAQLGNLGAWLTLPAGRCTLRLQRRRIGRFERGPEVAVEVREGETQYITLPAPPPVTERSPIQEGVVEGYQEQASEFERVGNLEAAEDIQARLAEYQRTGDVRSLRYPANAPTRGFDTGEVPLMPDDLEDVEDVP